MSNCKSLGQNPKESWWGERKRERGRERENPGEFADYFDWCVVGSWWVEEELPRAEGALRQHEEGEVGAKLCEVFLLLS